MKPLPRGGFCPASGFPSIGTRVAWLLTLGGTLIFSATGDAATKTWDGGTENDGLWSTAENWDPSTLATDGVAPVSGDDLVFSGEVNLDAENDLDTANGGSFLVNSITFDGLADVFTLTGNPLYLNGKTITNSSGYEQYVETEVQGGGSGFTVDCDSGDVTLGTITLVAGYNKALNKNGPDTLYIDGPLGNADTFQPNINEGTLVAGWNGNLFFHANIASGAVLQTEFNTIHNGGRVTLNGTLDLPGDTVEDIGNLTGGGFVTNHGASGQLSTLRIRNSENRTFSGIFEDGPSGGTTALEVGIAGRTESFTFTLSGDNTYTGDTTMQQASTKFALNSAGEMTFLIGASGVNNKITSIVPQSAGSVSLDGTFVIDISGVSAAGGDNWTLVDAAVLNESYGSNFNLIADDGLSFTAFTESTPGVWEYDDGSDVYVFNEATGQLAYGRSPVTTWDGGGNPDPNWSNNDNWDQLLMDGDLAIFDGNIQTTNVNDLDTNYVPADETDPENVIPADPASFTFAGIEFAPTADPFTLQGNAIDFVGKTITNNSPNTQTLELEIQCDAAIGSGGFTVDAADGEVVLNGLSLRNGFSKPLAKNGPGVLTLHGPMASADTWLGDVNEGTLVADWAGGNMFFHCEVSAGATFRTDANVIHNGGRVTLGGTLDLGGDVMLDVGAVFGSGHVTNHGTTGTTSTLRIRSQTNSGYQEFSGNIDDGTSGGVTALDIGLPGNTTAGLVKLSGANTYTGNTTFQQEAASFELTNTASLSFVPGANGVCNQITAAVPQTTGTTTLNGNFILDLGGADITHGNSWILVDAANLNENFGGGFQVNNAAYVPPTSFAVNSGPGTYGSFGEDDTYVSGGGEYAPGSPPAIDTSGVANPAPDGVYQTEHYGASTYTFTGLGPGASYTVRFHFAEIYHSSAGQRLADVTINGVLTLDAYDAFAAAGGKNKAAIEEVVVNADPSGNIVIGLAADVASVDGNPKISGIEIIPVGGGGGSNFSEVSDVWTMVDGENTWTFDESTGVLSLSVAGAAGGYSDWLAGYPGMTLTGRNEDNENDGRDNVLEYYLDGNPTVSDPALDPQGSYDALTSTFTFTFTRNDDATADTAAWFGYSSNLADWTKVMIPEFSGTVGAVTFTIQDNGTDPDDIEAEVSTGGAPAFFGTLGVE